MRLSRRTTLQLTVFFLVILFLNGYISMISEKREVLEDEKVPNEQSLDASQSKQDFRKRSLNQDFLKHRTNGSNSRNSLSNRRNEAKQHYEATNDQKSGLSRNKNLPKVQSTVIDDNFRRVSEGYLKVNELDPMSHSRPTELSDIFISVKTTRKFHKDRVGLLLDTWVQLAQDETYFFTDEDDEEYKRLIPDGHLINTNCSSVHNRVALCCKMSVEYDYFIASKKRWFCHVDDDTYVNIPRLSRLLQRYNHTQDWYLGKPSLNHPIEIADPETPGQKFAFWFATGGAGFCLSKGLALKMMPHTGGGRLKTSCAQIRLPDDCTIGFIIYYHLRKQMTSVQEFHSHLEGLWQIKPAQLDQQISYSYSFNYKRRTNTISVPGFNKTYDPTRFRSIHCRLFPYQKDCPDAPR